MPLPTAVALSLQSTISPEDCSPFPLPQAPTSWAHGCKGEQGRWGGGLHPAPSLTGCTAWAPLWPSHLQGLGTLALPLQVLQLLLLLLGLEDTLLPTHALQLLQRSLQVTLLPI